MADVPAEKVWEQVTPQERRKGVWIALGLVFIGCPLVWWAQYSDDTLARAWWLIWPLPAVCLPIALYLSLKKRRLVPAPNVVAKTAAEEAEAKRKQEEMEKKWWFRYGMAAFLCFCAWWLAEYRPGLWWLGIILVLAAAVHARELSLVILGLVLVGAGLWGLAAVPLPLAVVIAGALIAYAVYRRKDPTVDERIPLIGSFFRKRRETRETAAILSNPYFATLQLALDSFWSNSELMLKNFSEEGRANFRKQLVDEAVQIANEANPVQALREHLAEAVMEAAKYQVLVIPPEPEEDTAALRGVHGISGELKAHLLELATASKPLRDWLHGFGPVKVWDDVWNPVLFRHWYTLTRANVLSALRQPLDDAHQVRAMDWYRPFLETQCAYQEHVYREALGWPSNLPGNPAQAGLEAIKLSIYVNCVVQGAKYPDLDFADRMEKIERGDTF
ncbi:MAG: hypothetical protein ACJ8HI_13820 [Massilia sp.]